MKPLRLALASILAATVAVAHEANAKTATDPGALRNGIVIEAIGDPPDTLPPRTEPDADQGVNSGPDATAHADRTRPLHGANSFTRGEARARIAGGGFQDVRGLRMDRNGVWRGRAMRNGQRVGVWLDYMGNVGQQ